MMKRRILCLLLALLAAFGLCANAYANGPAPDVTAEPMPDVTASPSAEPVPADSAEPTAEPMPTDWAKPTAEPMPTDWAEPTAEPIPDVPDGPAAEPAPAGSPPEDDGAAVASAGQSGYRQTLARELFDKINALRTTPGVWYWRQDPPSGVSASAAESYKIKPRLSALAYSSDLENTAKDMTTMLANGYATPPTGDIAWVIGPITAQAAFDALAMEDGTYLGQQFRRVMLGNFTAVGIACYVRDGTYCWALKFSSSAAPSAPAPTDTIDGVVASGSGWKLEDSGTLTITSDAAMLDYGIEDIYPYPSDAPDKNDTGKLTEQVETTGSLAPWSDYASDITTVNIGQGVTRIGANAFASCWSLTDVSIPSTLTAIGESAFNWCSRLKTLDLSAAVGLRSIGPNAFASCSELSSLVIPDGVTSIGYTAFFGCEKLTSLTLPGDLADIGALAFEMCRSLRITVPCHSKAETCLKENFSDIPLDLVHTWNDGNVTKEPSRNATGIRTFSCTACGAGRTEIIPKIKQGWYWENGRWYWYQYQDGKSEKVTDSIVGGCYVGPDGAMRTGWIYKDGSWYYANANGYLQKGWLLLGRTWYYLDSDYKMLTGGFHEIGGASFFFDSSGAMLTGWIRSGGAWYYADAGGYLHKGWLLLGRTWYYLDSDYKMLTGGPHSIGGSLYCFDGSGAMHTGWVYTNGAWYYFTGSGAAARGWLLLGRTWYYLDSDHTMVTGWLELGSTKYYLDGSGAMRTGWLSLGDGDWSYFNGSGAMVRNAWVQSGRQWYYLDDTGLMARDTNIGPYYVNNAGVWVR